MSEYAGRNYVLLTGATGLLGQYLVRDMLSQGHRLAVLVRPTKKLTAAERVEQIMQMWEEQADQPLPRPVVITGDITKKNLGLADDDVAWIRSHCTTMLHCAASLQFHEYQGEPWRTNIEGTRNVLQLCEDNEIAEMHYISTAYVCGHRHDLVMEDELDVGQEFRNDYEKSKFQAETLVRECPAFQSLTVYRPVVITGDSKTGYTSTYHGTYLYMKLAAVLKQNAEPNEKGEYHVPVRWGLTGEERRNITPVDWNSTVICQIFDNPAAHGLTYHLAPSDPITMKDAISYASEYYGLTGIEFRGFGRKPDHPLNEMERWLWSNISIYGSYDFMDPQFDTSNLHKYAPVDCPKLDRQMAFLLMQYAEDDRWGKRKRPMPVSADMCVPAHSENLRLISATDEGTVYTVGLNIVGPGGGPWTIRLCDDQITDFEPGLPLDAAGVLTTTCAELAQLQGQGLAAAEQIQAQLKSANSEQLSHLLAAALLPQTIENR